MFKLKNTKLLTILLIGIALSAINFAPPLAPQASAAIDCTKTQLNSKASKEEIQNYEDQCGCKGKRTGTNANGIPIYDGTLDKNTCGIVQHLIKFINIMSGIVGVAIVIMIAIGGIQYSVARDNPQATVAARAKIINALVALVIFLFSFSFLQWVVPGGIF